jgi:Ser-tRNA(Ala) deacylase AlaX
MRYHTIPHVLNTIVLRDYQGWITGVQIGTKYSRIDFKLENFSAALCADLERKVNTILEGNHTLRAYPIREDEFQKRADLLRTPGVKPSFYPYRHPSHGWVRVVEIEGYDMQAWGARKSTPTPRWAGFR